MSGRGRVVVWVLVVLALAAGLVVWPSLRAATLPGASGAQGPLPILSSGARFRIVGQANATSNPLVFTQFSFVVPNHRAADITDVVVQNSHADSGTIRIQIGDEVLIEERLADVRTQQLHIPLHINADQPVVLAVNCQIPGPPEPANGKCAPAVSFFG